MRQATTTSLFLILVASSHGYVAPFSLRKSTFRTANLDPLSVSLLPTEASDDPRRKSYVLSPEEIKPIIRIGQGHSEKVINAFGLWCALVSLVTGPIWMAAMTIVNKLNEIYPDWDPHREIYDGTGKIWSKTWLTFTNSFPTISGEVDRLHAGHGPCLYVANHASWLDIPILCTVLDPVFKFIAKGELSKVPCIGQQLSGGNHILIDRDDRRSQLSAFKQGMAWLQKGVPIMAFPEGMRSPDGRLMEFKGGLFSMAVKCGVPIVPISLSHTHAVMPRQSLFPVQPGRNKIHLYVHEAIDTTDKSEKELAELVKDSFLSTLPFEQHPALMPTSLSSPVDQPSDDKPVVADNQVRELETLDA